MKTNSNKDSKSGQDNNENYQEIEKNKNYKTDKNFQEGVSSQTNSRSGADTPPSKNGNVTASINNSSVAGSVKSKNYKVQSMKQVLTLSSVLICFCIVMSTLVLAGSIFLKSTVFSPGFYQKVTTHQNYIPMLESAITQDLSAQSSFVSIPVENLTAGLDESQIKESLRIYVINTIDFLEGKGDFVKATYPANLFYIPLEKFILADGKAQKYTPSKEQYVLLQKVAEDSAIIVEKHVNIINVDTVIDIVKDKSAINNFQKALLIAKNTSLPAFLITLILVGLLIFLHRRNIDRAVLFFCTSLWIVGALMFVPSVALEIFGMTRRMSINTPYIKFAVDTWLTYSNRYFLVAGSILFIFSSIALILRIIINKPSKNIYEVAKEEQVDGDD